MFVCPVDQEQFSLDQAQAASYFCVRHRRYLCARSARPATIKAAAAILPVETPMEKEVPAPQPPTPSETFKESRRRGRGRSHSNSTPGAAEPAPSIGALDEAAVFGSQTAPSLTGVINSGIQPSAMERLQMEAPTSGQLESNLIGSNSKSSGASTTRKDTDMPNSIPANSTPPGPRAFSAPPSTAAWQPYGDAGPGQTTAAIVLPGQNNMRDAAAIEQLAGSLARLPAPVAFEINSYRGQRKLVLRGEPEALEHVRSSLLAVYGQIEIEPLKSSDDPAARSVESGAGVLLSVTLQAAKPPFLPFKMWREFENNDPLATILGAFDHRASDEIALSQVIVRGAAPADWAHDHLGQLVRLKRRGFGGDSPMPIDTIIRNGVLPLVVFLGLAAAYLWAVADWTRWLLAAPGCLVAIIGLGLLMQPPSHWAGALEEDAANKLREQALQVEIRLFAFASSRERAALLLNRLVSAYAVFNTTSGNRFQPVPTDGLSPLVCASPRAAKRILFMRTEQESLLLSVKELAGLWHLPVGETLDLLERQKWERLLPDRADDLSDPNGVCIGTTAKGQVVLPVCLSAEALDRNILTIGKTQHGKSTLMSHIASRWMRDPDRAVIIIDPHGDLAQKVIGLVTPERAQDVIYIDMTNSERIVGLNLLDLESGGTPDQIAEFFLDIGKPIWQDYWGPRMQNPLLFGLRALGHANLKRLSEPQQQYTILSLGDLLNCRPECRQLFLQREAAYEEAPEIQKYFVSEYEELSASLRDQIVQPVLSKLHAFERPAIRAVVGQPRSTVRPAEAIRNHKIIILNVNNGVLGNDLAGFIGSIFINVMQRMIKAQTTLPREERVKVSVMVDEFQVLQGVDFGSLLGETAKNGGNFCFGTQSLDNLRSIEEGGGLPGKVFAGVTTVVAFQCNGNDANYLVENELDHLRVSPESLINLDPYHAYVKTISSQDKRIPIVSVQIAPPLPANPNVIRTVLAGQEAYTVPASVANQQAKDSIVRFTNEYSNVSLAEEESLPNKQQKEAAGMLTRVYQSVPASRDSVPAVPITTGSQGRPPNSAQRDQSAKEARPRQKAPIGQVANAEAALKSALHNVQDTPGADA